MHLLGFYGDTSFDVELKIETSFGVELKMETQRFRDKKMCYNPLRP
jgi:hypothetical protein